MHLNFSVKDVNGSCFDATESLSSININDDINNIDLEEDSVKQETDSNINDDNNKENGATEHKDRWDLQNGHAWCSNQRLS